MTAREHAKVWREAANNIMGYVETHSIDQDYLKMLTAQARCAAYVAEAYSRIEEEDA